MLQRYRFKTVLKFICARSGLARDGFFRVAGLFFKLHGFADEFGLCAGHGLYPAIFVEGDTWYGDEGYFFIQVCVVM